MTKKFALLAGLLAVLSAPPLCAIELPPLNLQDPLQDGFAADNALPVPGKPVIETAVVVVTDAAPAETLLIPSESLWKRIRAGFAMPDLDSPLVARHEGAGDTPSPPGTGRAASAMLEAKSVAAE